MPPLLLALGVPLETVVADYLLSNEFRSEANRAMLDAVRPAVAAAQQVEPEAVDLAPLMSVVEVRREYLQVSVDAMHDDFGSVDGYLRAGLGFADDELRALRDELLE